LPNAALSGAGPTLQQYANTAQAQLHPARSLGRELASVAGIILTHATLIELALIVLRPKPVDNGCGIKIHRSVQVTPPYRASQLSVTTGTPNQLIMRTEVRLTTKGRMSVGNESDRKLAALNCLCDLLDRVKLLLAKTPNQIMAQASHVPSDREVLLDAANHTVLKVSTPNDQHLRLAPGRFRRKPDHLTASRLSPVET
jgi:hypothetical protein